MKYLKVVISFVFVVGSVVFYQYFSYIKHFDIYYKYYDNSFNEFYKVENEVYGFCLVGKLNSELEQLTNVYFELLYDLNFDVSWRNVDALELCNKTDTHYVFLPTERVPYEDVFALTKRTEAFASFKNATNENQDHILSDEKVIYAGYFLDTRFKQGDFPSSFLSVVISTIDYDEMSVADYRDLYLEALLKATLGIPSHRMRAGATQFKSQIQKQQLQDGQALDDQFLYQGEYVLAREMDASGLCFYDLIALSMREQDTDRALSFKGFVSFLTTKFKAFKVNAYESIFDPRCS